MLPTPFDVDLVLLTNPSNPKQFTICSKVIFLAIVGTYNMLIHQRKSRADYDPATWKNFPLVPIKGRFVRARRCYSLSKKYKKYSQNYKSIGNKMLGITYSADVMIVCSNSYSNQTGYYSYPHTCSWSVRRFFKII